MGGRSYKSNRLHERGNERSGRDRRDRPVRATHTTRLRDPAAPGDYRCWIPRVPYVGVATGAGGGIISTLKHPSSDVLDC